VLEHIPDDEGALRELVRVLRPGGRMAVTVPTRWPERICWALDHRYHDTPGGHVRIYRQPELEAKLERAGLVLRGSQHAHALHSPYWMLKCAVGVDNADALPVRKYHDFLVWELTKRPRWAGVLDRALNPVLGKSLVVYTEKLR
jgi:SAM-dependent methyltransferase